MSFIFPSVTPRWTVSSKDWSEWQWQMRQSLKSQEDFAQYFDLTDLELQGFKLLGSLFKAQTTPYYASLASKTNANDPVRKILMPTQMEALENVFQQSEDPLAEKKPSNAPVERIVHRYSDRVLFLLTDFCGVYCRYCTRKHFTAQDHAMIRSEAYQKALSYIQHHPGIKEVILSGGDPLTLSDAILERVLTDVRKISHVEIIRIHSRMPVVNPMRVTVELAKILRRAKPVYVVTHFNHPQELTEESAQAVENFVDHGVPTLNQMVLLNGINNHAAIVQALSRRLLYLRVKPYYMFQCDPSVGTDHLRTSIENSLEIQKELWGHLSGLAMPTLVVDIPNGGGKAALTPNYQILQNKNVRTFQGWDGVQADYISPTQVSLPNVADEYLLEWEQIKTSKSVVHTGFSQSTIEL